MELRKGEKEDQYMKIVSLYIEYVYMDTYYIIQLVITLNWKHCKMNFVLYEKLDEVFMFKIVFV